MSDQRKLICLTEERLEDAFTECDRRYRENPEQFMSEASHLLHETAETYGAACAPYFMQILDEVAVQTAVINESDAERRAGYRDSPTGHRRVPASYQSATWRNALPVDDNFLELGVGFNLDSGEVIRLRLDLASARHLVGSVSDYIGDHDARSHSDKSSGMSRSDVSTPEE